MTTASASPHELKLSPFYPAPITPKSSHSITAHSATPVWSGGRELARERFYQAQYVPDSGEIHKKMHGERKSRPLLRQAADRAISKLSNGRGYEQYQLAGDAVLIAPVSCRIPCKQVIFQGTVGHLKRAITDNVLELARSTSAALQFDPAVTG